MQRWQFTKVTVTGDPSNRGNIALRVPIWRCRLQAGPVRVSVSAQRPAQTDVCCSEAVETTLTVSEFQETSNKALVCSCAVCMKNKVTRNSRFQLHLHLLSGSHFQLCCLPWVCAMKNVKFSCCLASFGCPAVFSCVACLCISSCVTCHAAQFPIVLYNDICDTGLYKLRLAPWFANSERLGTASCLLEKWKPSSDFLGFFLFVLFLKSWWGRTSTGHVSRRSEPALVRQFGRRHKITSE